MKWKLLLVLSLSFSKVWAQTNNTSSCSVLKRLMTDMIQEHTSQEEEEYKLLLKELVPQLDQVKLAQLQSEFDNVKFSPPLVHEEVEQLEILNIRVAQSEKGPTAEELKWLNDHEKVYSAEVEAKKDDIKRRQAIHNLIMGPEGKLSEESLSLHKELLEKEKNYRIYREETEKKSKALKDFFASSMHTHLKTLDRASPGDKWGKIFVNGQGYLFDRSKPLEGNFIESDSKDKKIYKFSYLRNEVSVTQLALKNNEELESLLLKFANNSQSSEAKINKVLFSSKATFDIHKKIPSVKYDMVGLEEKKYTSTPRSIFNYHELSETELIGKFLPEECHDSLASSESHINGSGREVKKSERGFFRRIFGGGQKSSKQ